jgi:NADH-quinone oxidoreductase subunit L
VLLWLVATCVAGLTAFYMFRQVFMVFFGECRADHHTQEHLHESPPVMTVPLWILAAGSILVGYLGVPHVLAAPAHIPHFFNDWLAPVFGGHGPIEEHAPAGGETAMELLLMAVSVGTALAGAGLAYLMYYRGTIRPEVFSEAAGGAPYRAVLNKYYVDELYDLVFVRGTLLLSRAAAWFDLHVIDGIVNLAAVIVREVSRLGGFLDNLIVDGAVNAVAEVVWAIGGRMRRIQTGAISAYLYVVVLGMLGGVFLWWSWAVAS